jgi:general L-amino acid transport system permease protein
MGRPVDGIPSQSRALFWLRRNFFRRWYDAVFTALLAAGLIAILARVYRWAVADAAFSPDPEACRSAAGACWSVVADMWPLFLAGLYPSDERWRVHAGFLLLGIAIALTLIPAVRKRSLVILLCCIVPVSFLVLVHGGVFGLAVVEPQKWGGILLTVILAVVSQTVAFPFGLALALARHSRRHAGLRTAATIYIEIVRSVPLVMVLLMTTLILPLFLPPTLPLNTVVTAAIGITMFSAAAIAEVVRGGLNGLPQGQEEAAASLGLRYGQTMRLVVLPQALHRVQPALVGTLITFVKGSTLVVAIGLYDLLGSAVLASTNPTWVGHSIEPLIFVAALFWVMCFALSRISRRMELRRSEAHRGDGVAAGAGSR